MLQYFNLHLVINLPHVLGEGLKYQIVSLSQYFTGGKIYDTSRLELLSHI